MIDNQVIDCLLPIKYFPKNIKRAADFGSGGGLPGVVYALQFPEISWTLFEKSHLKQDFLNECVKISKNIKVLGEIPLELKDIHCVTSRAFKAVDVLLDMSRTYYKSGGKYFLLKGRKEKIDEELLLAKKKFKDLRVEITELKSPVLDVERHLVSIG
ncbi:MAG: 16S rRNA (guanine(527)-N(7))-methyltransferase RsmG [Pseudobdellovibrionaceae bacterium]